MSEPTAPLALLEFDEERVALIEPAEVFARRRGTVPSVAVLCFFSEILETLSNTPGVEQVATLVAAHGRHPIWALTRDDTRVAVLHPGVGAPLAAGFLEETIALGARTVVACGGAGAVVPELAVGHVVLPDAAVRDEGTSFHYLPASREVAADALGVRVAERVLRERGVPYTVGKTWTTDGLYRETRSRIARRRAEGCITVEMEAAAFFAVARFRSVRFAQLLYAGDDVSGAVWNSRKWERSASRQLTFDLAVDVAVALSREAGR
jgi:uridine phosphorylase